MTQHFDWAWLPNSLRKGISLPKIIYEDDKNQNYSGYFTHGIREIHIVESDDDDVHSTIAHEFCHYLQYFDNRIIDLKNTSGSVYNIHKNETYEHSIYRFFTTYPCEMESLLFEHKYAKAYYNNYWLNKIIKEKYFG